MNDSKVDDGSAETNMDTSNEEYHVLESESQSFLEHAVISQNQSFNYDPTSVQLSPGWEDLNPPSADDVDPPEHSLNVPVLPDTSRLSVVYFILILLGIGILMPWTMLTTSFRYFMIYTSKLPANSSEDEDSNDGYQLNAFQFDVYFGYAGKLGFPAMWLNILATVFQWGRLKARILWCLFATLLMLILTFILAFVDMSAFLWVTLSSAITISVASGFYQSCLYELAARFGFSFIGAIVLSTNVTNVLTTSMAIISMITTPTEQTVATFYFTAALLVTIICCGSYFILWRTELYQKCKLQFKFALQGQVSVTTRPQTECWRTLKNCWVQCLNIFLLFLTTSLIFPMNTYYIRRVDEDFLVADKYFLSICGFLTFSVCAAIGNLLTGLTNWPSPKFLFLPVLLHMMFIPFFLMCNYKPYGLYERVEVSLPAFHFNDWVYWLGNACFGLSYGYLSCLSMMYCAKVVKPHQAPLAAMLGAVFLAKGIMAGIKLGFFIPWLFIKYGQ